MIARLLTYHLIRMLCMIGETTEKTIIPLYPYLFGW